ncbi:MAG: bifunctional 2-dehydro-3-deoxygluconokinase/2-dehydro-3-deoxygalactonokinase [Halapricum sp.]
MTELLTFGETMLRLSPPRGQRLADAREFDAVVGGAESNVATATAQLGRDVRWASRLPDSPLGRRVVRELRSNGVTPEVVWDDQHRLGTYYLEHGSAPRPVNVVYDRADSAFTHVTGADLPIETIGTADIVYTSGITPGLSDATADVTETFLETASDAGAVVSFDLNYRSKLWDHEAARATFESLFDHVDLLFAPERDVSDVLGIDGTPEQQAERLADEYDIETVVVTLGSEGALALQDGELYRQSAIETETFDAIGTGDAFVGGFLAERLAGSGVERALAYGAATAALKRTMGGDAALLTQAEVAAVVDGAHDEISR